MPMLLSDWVGACVLFLHVHCGKNLRYLACNPFLNRRAMSFQEGLGFRVWGLGLWPILRYMITLASISQGGDTHGGGCKV